MPSRGKRPHQPARRGVGGLEHCDGAPAHVCMQPLSVAAAQASQSTILMTAVAGLVAGAMSMAAGEYVSVHSQAGTEKADLERERRELAADPAAEVRELASIYVGRGLDAALAQQVAALAPRLTDGIYSYGADPSLATPWIPGHGPRLKAVVFDASELLHTGQLKQLREFFQPLLKNLQNSAHLVILGRAPESLDDPFAASAQRALEGFARSLAKELRNGGTVQLLQVDPGAQDQLEGALRFFLSPKSAFISGQVLRLNACGEQVKDWTRPLAGRKALVTGAARGIGASIAETLARDGAQVLLLDVPQAKADLDALAQADEAAWLETRSRFLLY